MMQLLGSHSYQSISLTSDEFRNIQKLYVIEQEKPVKKPEAPVAPKREDFDVPYKYQDALRDHEKAVKVHDNWKSPHALLQAGADHNVMRHASADGLRIVAWLSKYVEAGSDPLKLVVQLASEAGFDVDPEDLEWSESED